MKAYEKAGVNIALGDALVEKLKAQNSNIGGFGGVYPLSEEQSLVAGTDGVGTKLELHIKEKSYDHLAQDLLAMCVNDIVVLGARPLFFLDYFATGKLDVDVTFAVVEGVRKACSKVGCVLLGGETAEMPGFYPEDKFDVAGFSVGLVDNKNIVSGENVKEGDVIVGLPSSGFHSNGYSLIRKTIAENNLSLSDVEESTGKTWGTLLTEGTRLYVQDVLKVMEKVTPKAMAHITGGGLSNIERPFPEGLKASVDKSRVPTPQWMKTFVKIADISEEECWEVWNMGMGFTFVLNESG